MNKFGAMSILDSFYLNSLQVIRLKWVYLFQITSSQQLFRSLLFVGILMASSGCAGARAAKTDDLLDNGRAHELTRFNIGEFVNSLAWSPDGRYLAASDQRAHKLYLWDVKEKKLIADTKNSAANKPGLAFTRDGKYILSSSGANMAAFSVFDGHTGAWITDVSGTDASHGGNPSFSALAILPSPDGRYVYVLHSSSETYGVYEVGTWKIVSIVSFGSPPRSKLSAALSPDGAFLAFGTYDGDVDVWSAPKGERVGVIHAGIDQFGLKIPFAQSHVFSLSFSPDSQSLAIGSTVNRNTYDHQLQIWGTRSLSFSRYFHTGINEGVSCLSYSHDGALIATVELTNSPKPIVVWAAESAEKLGTIPTDGKIVGAVAFSPMSGMLAYGGEGHISIFQITP